MGNVSITRWQCDRCGALEDSKPYPAIGLDQHQVNVTKMIGDNTYDVLCWTELCHSCVSAVDDQIQGIIEGAERSRAEAAEKRVIQL